MSAWQVELSEYHGIGIGHQSILNREGGTNVSSVFGGRRRVWGPVIGQCGVDTKRPWVGTEEEKEKREKRREKA